MSRRDARDIRVWVQEKKGSKNLFLQWVDEDNKRHSPSAGTSDRREAERRAKDKEYELRHGLERQRSGDLTWAEFRALYEAEVLAGRRPRSQEKVGTVLDVFEAEMKPQRLAAVDARTLSRFVQALRGRPRPGGRVGLAPVTVRNYLVDLKAALGWALRQKFLAELPEFPEIKVPKKRPQPVPQADFDRLLAAAPDPQWRAFLLCGWYAGLRLSEAQHLRRGPSGEYPWADLANSRIILPAEFAKADVDQWVPLHSTLRAALDALPLRTDGDRYFDLRSQSQRSRGQPLTRSGISTAVIQMARAAGVRLSMHRLRKGFISRMAVKLGQGGAPVLHKLARHSSLQVTMDYYANVDQAVQDSIELID